MASRAYNNQTRQQLQTELKQRIVEAAVQMHAQKGGLGTSYADIAQAAGVSLPTVYKHFPQLDTLFQSCTAHVAQAAPALPVDSILAAPDLASAALQLVDAMDQLNAYFEPWLVWRDHGRNQFLAELGAQRRQQLTGLCAAILARHGLTGGAALWESLLHFELWHRLVRGHQLPRAEVRRSLHQLLLAVAGPLPATSSSAGPT
ncbi:TetR/AcrR family transcriptional regulator [Caenimonas soli]|uniref:TetR/AcrR family transcriptional regulator n=1 Tax=Caenimonas soli TaxID=2735555 RepID=UPI0015574EED|nr:TetR/AcrR family transcriptional regulator [Caenimonas soli]NPC55170.1 TetR/AcrR family transcriptional regulator [Caenimonas soli]